MEKTTIRTVEITEIGDLPERDIETLIKDYLGADDVHVIKEQVFEMPTEQERISPFSYIVRLALKAKRGDISRSEFADAVISELSPMMTPEEALRCLGSL